MTKGRKSNKEDERNELRRAEQEAEAARYLEQEERRAKVEQEAMAEQEAIYQRYKKNRDNAEEVQKAWLDGEAPKYSKLSGSMSPEEARTRCAEYYLLIDRAKSPEEVIKATGRAMLSDIDVDYNTGVIVQAILTVGLAQLELSREQYADTCRRSDIGLDRTRTALTGQAEILRMQREIYDENRLKSTGKGK